MFDAEGQTGSRSRRGRAGTTGLLPAVSRPADSTEIRPGLAGDAERYASACVRTGKQQGFVLSGQGRGESASRDLTAVPPEFRPACGRPGSHVIVRQVPVTIPHAICDLTGVRLSYPGYGGAAVTAPPGPHDHEWQGLPAQG